MPALTPAKAAELSEKYCALATLESEKGYLDFLGYVTVDALHKKPFRRIAEAWQWERAQRSAPALDHLAGISPPGKYTGPVSFWNGYHKGSDKTHETARQLLWLLGWSKRRLNMYVCAGDQDQAKLLTTAMTGICRDNKWINDRCTVTAEKARGESGSEVTVMAMDAWTGQGIFPDLVVAEEVTHWQHDEGRQFWNFVLSSVNKRPGCVLIVNTNAGHIGSWQWEERKRVSVSKFWSFYEAPVGDPLAKWMNKEKIADDSRGMTKGEQARLYTNRWVDPGEEKGYLTQEDADACIDPTLIEEVKGKRDYEYFAIVDYGGVFDRCALCVMHIPPGSDTAIVDRLDCWQGSHEDRIDINTPEDDPERRSVEGWLDATVQSFRVAKIIVDPNQLEALAIKFERRGYWVDRFPFRRGMGNYRMAQVLKTCVQNKKVRWSPFAGLLHGVEDDTISKELARLVIVKKSYGYRFDHEAGRHDDRAAALAMGLAFAFPETMPADSHGPKVIDVEDPPERDEPYQDIPPQLDFAASWGLFGIQPQRRHPQ